MTDCVLVKREALEALAAKGCGCMHRFLDNSTCIDDPTTRDILALLSTEELRRLSYVIFGYQCWFDNDAPDEDMMADAKRYGEDVLSILADRNRAAK